MPNSPPRPGRRRLRPVHPRTGSRGWARTVTRDPNGTSAADVQALRDVGLEDGQIMAVTVFVALRIAFSTVNDALGAAPDAELVAGIQLRSPMP